MIIAISLCAIAGPASADGFYFSESAGGTRVKDELSAYMGDAVRIRLAIGIRRRQWAVEGWIAGDIANDSVTSDAGAPSPNIDTAAGYGPTTLTTFGLDLKYLQPVASHVEVYLRGSMSRGEMSGSLDGFGGRGLGAGAGIQLKGKVPAIGFLWAPLFFTNWGPKVTASLFVDTGYDFLRLHGDRATGIRGPADQGGKAIDAQLSHMTFGFGVGSDF